MLIGHSSWFLPTLYLNLCFCSGEYVGALTHYENGITKDKKVSMNFLCYSSQFVEIKIKIYAVVGLTRTLTRLSLLEW